MLQHTYFFDKYSAFALVTHRLMRFLAKLAMQHKMPSSSRNRRPVRWGFWTGVDAAWRVIGFDMAWWNKTACEDEDNQMDIYSLYIYSTGKKSLPLEKTPAHWTLHSQLVWQYRVPSGKNLPTKQAFCQVESWDWFWMKGACQYVVRVTFLWDCPGRNFNGEFQPSGNCGGCLFF